MATTFSGFLMALEGITTLFLHKFISWCRHILASALINDKPELHNKTYHFTGSKSQTIRL